MKHLLKIPAVLAGVFAVMAAPPTFADDSEVFTSSSFTTNKVLPNILFIIDTSGSMDDEVDAYDPSVTYDGPCTTTDRVYWTTVNNKQPPSCTSDQWVQVDNNRCRTAYNGMKNGGWWRGRTAMLISGGAVNPSRWDNLVPGRDAKLECQGDSGNHGDRPGSQAAGSENKYARNGIGTSDSNRWGASNSSNQVSWNGRQQISMYSTNYMNYYFGTGTKKRVTRLSIVRDAAKNLIDNLSGVNLGIMRYSSNAQGGMVTYPISELTDANRTAMKAELDTYLAAGNTPLSETMYEAYLYLSGGKVDYGNQSTWTMLDPDNGPVSGVSYKSVAASRVGDIITGEKYKSPMQYSCQNTFVVYLTDGLPTDDNDADEKMEGSDDVTGLPDFEKDGGTCPKQIDDPDKNWPTAGRCLESITRYMRNHDLRPDSEVFGAQTVTSYFIGFGEDIKKSEKFLQQVAKAGGGSAYTAEDAPGLASTLEEIINEVVDSSDTTFVSPAVSVNAFNRTQNFNDLFVSVFAPSKNRHWPGNLKKYRIIDGVIHGTDEKDPAVDPATGFFKKTAKATNTPDADPADGFDAKSGGSAARLTGSKYGWKDGERRLYTYLGSIDSALADTDLTADVNAITVANSSLTGDMLDTGGDADQRQRVIEFSRGRDLNDDNKNKDIDEPRKRMGDPMHARPAIVIYGGTAEAPVGTVFTPTNDGYLHAFDMNTGNELWAFVPPAYLKRLLTLYNNPPTPNRSYSLDGDIRVFKYDVDQDGVVEPEDGDKVYLFFGEARGGSSYYSLDVTDQNKPIWRWRKNSLDYPRLGRTWSTPQIARVNIKGATQNDQKLVLIFGGGYDTVQDANVYTTDSAGNGVYMVDIETGKLLWRASSDNADFNDANMTHSIPSAITVLDTDGDKYADRMYASDMGGRVWRFDITNGNTVDELVQGGVLASLGGAAVDSGSRTLADVRRFYGSPDVAPISLRGSRPFMNIAIGSGYRGHPLETTTQDRFYSIRDYNPFNKRDNDSYTKTGAVIKDGDLVDITDDVEAIVPDGAKGWKLLFDREGWRGEKVLADSVTAAGVIFFPTFTPLSPDPEKPCLARTGNRLYAVYAANGRPFTRWVDSPEGDPSPEDRYIDLAQKGIAPALTILANPNDPTHQGICQVGAQILNRCVEFGSAIRSFWEHK